MLAIAIVLGVWQLVVWSGWRPVYVLPGPAAVLNELWGMMQTERFWQAVATTMRRAVTGFAFALLLGTVVGVLVGRVRTLRLAIGSLITGLQTMPSIAWFPLAILLFGFTERAIFFVVVLGAAPSIANGVISGMDHIPPQFLRLGRVLGARGVSLYRFIVLPAALPAYVSGLNQGWAFAWRSLMAGELLLATMLAILIIGMLVDGVFTSVSHRLRRRRGLAIDD
jgi:NitT/TauT family transport system permease protein